MLSRSGIIDNEPKASDTAVSQDTPSPVQELIKVLMVALQADQKKSPLGKGKISKQASWGWECSTSSQFGKHPGERKSG